MDKNKRVFTLWLQSPVPHQSLYLWLPLHHFAFILLIIAPECDRELVSNCRVFFRLFQVAMDKNKRVFTWGFGGYGRLGHSSPKDEMIPRLLTMFEGANRGASMVAAGSAYSMAVAWNGRNCFKYVTRQNNHLRSSLHMLPAKITIYVHPFICYPPK